MIRNIDGWELSSTVAYDGNVGPILSIWVKNVARGIHREHRLEGFKPASDADATRLVDDALFQVTGVNSDGTLRHR